ncbi:MAG TPA: ferredoxin [Acidimicrobiales bacterium]|nr:ferredoxin [Acidimicrobiales bacterium]
MKVRLDPDRCQGHGRCYTLAPALFSGDDEIPADQARRAESAAANCPEHAITLDDA